MQADRCSAAHPKSHSNSAMGTMNGVDTMDGSAEMAHMDNKDYKDDMDDMDAGNKGGMADTDDMERDCMVPSGSYHLIF